MSIELKTFGERVTWLLRRPETDMSQKELAAAMGVSAQFLNSLIKGKSKPNVAHLRAIARLLHTSVDFLALETDNPEVPDTEEVDSGHGISEEAAEIAELVDRLPPWRRRELLVWLRYVTTPDGKMLEEAQTAAADLRVALRLDESVLGPQTVRAIEAAMLRYVAGPGAVGADRAGVAESGTAAPRIRPRGAYPVR